MEAKLGERMETPSIRTPLPQALIGELTPIKVEKILSPPLIRP